MHLQKFVYLLGCIAVPSGYEVEDMYETDDTGDGFDKPVLEEEVRISFGRRNEE